MNAIPYFHPAVSAWFSKTFPAPTPAQTDAWPAIQSGRHVLIAAPTGSGKTLAAFLAAIDELVREGEQWGLPDETRIVYVSPLKALSNDVNRNLEAPLAGIREELRGHTIRDVEIRTWVRTGDTPQYERSQMRRKPPHIVVTTPESLYILLGSQSGREMLATTRSVIVDEIHAVAGTKRGSHLALSLERLEALTGRRLTRIGLSATQKPLEEVARFLVGRRSWKAAGAADCAIVDSGHVRRRDLAIELPDAPLEAVMSNEVWTQVYDRLAQLIREHRTTLVFVNTRRLAERVCRHLAERLDDAVEAIDGAVASDVASRPHRGVQRKQPSNVAAHHGSLAKELRFDAEQRLKRGDLKALVATASLELGIDIGDVDLVCQLSSPRSINAFLQRAGRSGHAVGGTPKGRLFPLSRDDLAECTALLDSVRRAELDRLKIPLLPVDVLAQQIVAEVAARDCTENELYELLCNAYPFQSLSRETFEETVRMLAEGFTTRRGRHGAMLYHDAVNRTLRGRKGARLTAITSGGAIPDTADYQVMLEPEGHLVGTVNEDFAVESLAGDVFQLGNSSYRIIRVERSTVRVEDARGEAPTIPFWLGEAPGRTDELSASVSRLREEIQQRLEASLKPGPLTPALSHEGRGGQSSPAPSSLTGESQNMSAGDSLAPSPLVGEGRGEGAEAARQWLTSEVGISEAAATQLVEYLAAAHAALGCLPTQKQVVFERFFDEAGGMQLVIHSPFGSRINRAWGLALRKRFCRTFNFELQAAATEDTIVLSLTTAHSFELADVARYLHPNTAREILIQALLAAPMFTTRWRWDASIALALPRFRGGKKVPPPLARMNAEDLLASVFPDQVACGENLTGDIVVPDHPLVQQTVRDCLEEAMDFAGFERLLTDLTQQRIEVAARDLTEPSPLALEVLSARPYAYLDDAPLEERRTQAVMSRRWIDPESAADIGKLDPQAIARVREEAWPDAATADELHDALLWLTFMTAEEVERQPAWPGLMHELMTQRRVTRFMQGATPLFVATERVPFFQALLTQARFDPEVIVPAVHAAVHERESALREIVRGRLAGLGPTSAAAIAASLSSMPSSLVAPAAAASGSIEASFDAVSSVAAAAGSTEASFDTVASIAEGAIASSPGISVADVDAALIALEAEGTAMRGTFEPASAVGWAESSKPNIQLPSRMLVMDEGALGEPVIASRAGFEDSAQPTVSSPQWCDRRLLARIHRYTVKRLRAEIEPVQARDFLRFLFDWQRVTPTTRMQGPDAIPAVLAQLEGFDAPASAWETEVLPARIAEYEPAWLDEQCLAGRVVWTRLATRSGDAERGAAPVRATPIALLPRRNARLWAQFSGDVERSQLTGKAQQVAGFIAAHGASFFDEIVEGAGLLPTQTEEALGELVALGLVNSDSFGGLRALLVPSDRRRPTARDARRKRRIAIFGMQDAGRWALVKKGVSFGRAQSDTADPAVRALGASEAIEHVCSTLLRRWGVVFWKLLEREADWLPPWREMLMCLRRMESRGEIRGGRFIAGFSGEQFALPEAVAPLREARRKPLDGQTISLSAADPLNLVGVLTPGARLPALTGNRVLYRDGIPLALYVGGEVRFIEQVEAQEEWQMRNALLRRQVPAPLADLA